MKKFSNVVEK